MTDPLLLTASDIDVGIRSTTRMKVSVPVPLVFVALSRPRSRCRRIRVEACRTEPVQDRVMPEGSVVGAHAPLPIALSENVGGG